MSTCTGDLLIASPARWNECCFAVPAVRALLRSGWDIGLLCTTPQVPFWETVPGLRILAPDPKDGARSVAKLLRDQWRTALVWEDGLFADAIRKAAIPRTIGPQGERWAKWLSHPADLAEKPKNHRVESYLAAARHLGQDTRTAQLFAPVAWPGVADRQPLLLIPDSDFGPSHEWPLEHWLDLTQRLGESGHIYQIADMAGGRGLGRRVAQDAGVAEWVSITVSATALPQLAGFQTVIAADGSLPHLASHVGASCLTLFGPNDPRWKRPLGRRHLALQHHVECAPCFLSRCPLDHRCQRELTATRVWLAFLEWLDASED